MNKPLKKVRTIAGKQTVIRDLSGAAREGPTRTAMAKNATLAAGRVVRNVVRLKPVKLSKAERDSRIAICRQCEYWDGFARMGWGKCNHPQCGCSKLKAWFATEQCPAGKWPRLTTKAT